MRNDLGSRDLRLPALGLAAWAGALVGLHPGVLTVLPGRLGWWLGATLLGAALGWTLLRRRWTVTAWIVVAVAVAAGAGFRQQSVTEGAVARLAAERAAVAVEVRVTDDPRPARGLMGDQVRVRVRVERLHRDGRAWRVRSPVLVFADAAWERVEIGGRYLTRLRLAPSRDADLAATAAPLAPPRIRGDPSAAWRAAGTVRAGIREAVSTGGSPERTLVPALVDGDDADLPEQVKADFRTTGMTHLLAVSGTNLTLVVGFLVVAGRWCGVRGRWHYLLAVLGIVGFILLARTEPSVVRAAAMGTAALLGMAHNGRDRGIRALGLAVLGLMAWDPWLATTVGFALSVLATAGILLLAPGWVDAMSRWLPRWAAQAVAVPLAAQVACTPVVAAISGEVSLVAVLANLLAAPLVAPATILGLLGGLVVLVVPSVGHLAGHLACWAAAGIIWIAERCAGLSLPAITWGTGALALATLTLLCVLVVAVAGPVLARRATALPTVCLLGVVLLVPLPRPGWPPDGWVMVGCDVGQGDGLVLRAGPAAGVVVDAGPDAAAMRRCLDRLGIEQVPLLVFSHFHADHVDGLPGVLRGREVGEVLVTGHADPADAAERVLASVGAHTRVPAYGETLRVGEVLLQVVGPVPGSPVAGPNDASLVLLAEVRGVRILLTGDVEPPAQAALARSLTGLRVDVLKVPHHGSRHQDLDFLGSLRPRVALVSAGEDNDYGHPAPETLGALAAAGVVVLRTDRDGDVAVVRREGRLRAVR